MNVISKTPLAKLKLQKEGMDKMALGDFFYTGNERVRHPHKPTDTDSGVDEIFSNLFSAIPAEGLGEALANATQEVKELLSQSIKQELEGLLGEKVILKSGVTDCGGVSPGCSSSRCDGHEWAKFAVPVSVIQERLKRYE